MQAHEPSNRVIQGLDPAVLFGKGFDLACADLVTARYHSHVGHLRKSKITLHDAYKNHKSRVTIETLLFLADFNESFLVMAE